MRSKQIGLCVVILALVTALTGTIVRSEEKAASDKPIVPGVEPMSRARGTVSAQPPAATRRRAAAW